MAEKSRFEFYCTRWGSENIPWDIFFEMIKINGYDGIEYGIPSGTPQKTLDNVWNLASRYGVKIIPHHYDIVTTNFSEHQERYEAWFEMISYYDFEKINAQTGRDVFDYEDNKKLFEYSFEYQKSKGVVVAHETHRQRSLFAAHVAKAFLEKIPDLHLTLDISHWICVAETYLHDQTAAVSLAIDRAVHLHARIGHPQGAQVSDPRADEWQDAVDIHLHWWRSLAKKIAESKRVLTITPEFGPSPYMFCYPYSRQPCANQWDINLYMMHLLREEL